eukprot:CAMPEP_0194366774 /NCGR_PEP_ID=MMETSP0174-20130528/14853_1 /TAXON_ID=216777 /ORGANISM="Proboscia alata, Strain PI-D3" /LENGTH=232 /DNA_ID=CAMNT_0039142171 /DNA_START=89 /DNA_END=784 /DNA_ORIENTATION=+
MTTDEFVGSSASQDARDFINCFIQFSGKDKESSLSDRKKEWSVIDRNKIGSISKAEIDTWIREKLVNALGPDRGQQLKELFKSTFLRAYGNAKHISGTKGDTRLSGTDSVTFKEFRIFIAYLCIYALMDDAFFTLKGSFPTDDEKKTRTLSLQEWCNGYSHVNHHGFFALRNILEEDIETMFHKIGKNGSGYIFLDEWCNFLEKTEAKMGTYMGNLLSLGNHSASTIKLKST